ncbi:E3 SUMO-protein ligase ZBED1 [Corythoichthys intestinalis]|uniref:E3 SUMO-protein ligase ZBED1 n=1 Tax=Corythoichthys intestinalis TaxID=161448 RepID=UPI0025A579F5|nr:E3 SUMO-protein ligase ZBED1 [Corythoichthys intestinalis]
MANAASISNNRELEDPPATLRSPVWEHFGFPVNYKPPQGQRQIDKNKVVCRHCSTDIGYVSGNTSNMLTHLKRHHPSVNIATTKRKTSVVQTTLPTAFKQPFSGGSDRAKAITNAVGVFIAADLRPYSVVENAGFKHMIKVIEPRYQLPSRPHFSQKIIPGLYEKTKAAVTENLLSASAIALTTDGWTSRATESYLTVTAHYITPEWTLASYVLQTRPIYEQHTSTILAEGLKGTVLEWKLERPGTTITVTTDNARNIVNSVKEAGLGPQIGCFAHTINLASQKATGLNQVSRVLGKVRRIVSFFHRSSTAAHILENKQEMLSIPKHTLIQDVPTRWNSSHDMLERYLEQQAAVYSALTEKVIKKNKDINTLSDQDVRMAEEIVEVLKPLKTITTLISTEATPSASMILPLKTTVLKSMEPNEEDSPTVSEVKAAIRDNLEDRYSDCEDFLHKCTALDPRFKTLPHVDNACRERIYNSLITEIVLMDEKSEEATATSAASSSSGAGHSGAQESSPPVKKSAMTELFGTLFKTQVGDKPTLQLVKVEVTSYKAVNCIALDSDPLLWWKTNETIFPLTAKLARHYLAIPATSVPSERVFSTAGDIVTASRSALSADNVDKLIFLAKNMKIE